MTIGGSSFRINGSRGLSSTKYSPGAAVNAAIEILLLCFSVRRPHHDATVFSHISNDHLSSLFEAV